MRGIRRLVLCACGFWVFGRRLTCFCVILLQWRSQMENRGFPTGFDLRGDFGEHGGLSADFRRPPRIRSTSWQKWGSGKTWILR
ncbi:hypothetical protein L596_006505 [Steinernema carpocapsae]|uniref:Uncharacterized protein n=1 Tax=Steinernema carpocapsae TaxID=34508 RepID=A0A4U8V298_STECR|nr:hypothetical protein L596_006505 [Steinernema carpocapsae]